ncbi:hypothetical protein Syun_019104 [Stephania yunnanensis]|uniref:BSD domain-containing protein n=1 Tax=Stephania yunnanensis TaxID=152371 RepID=A0AAP0IVG1_9MAGN
MTSRFENGILCEVYAKAVPELVDDEGFWFRYFYRIDKAKQVEEARADLVRRAVSDCRMGRSLEELTTPRSSQYVGASAVVAIETASCRRVCRRSSRLPPKPSPSVVAASEALALYRRCL